MLDLQKETSLTFSFAAFDLCRHDQIDEMPFILCSGLFGFVWSLSDSFCEDGHALESIKDTGDRSCFSDRFEYKRSRMVQKEIRPSHLCGFAFGFDWTNLLFWNVYTLSNGGRHPNGGRFRNKRSSAFEKISVAELMNLMNLENYLLFI